MVFCLFLSTGVAILYAHLSVSQKSVNCWGWKENPLRSSNAGSARAGCPGPHPVGVWVSPHVKTTTSLSSLFQCLTTSTVKEFLYFLFFWFVPMASCLVHRYDCEEPACLFFIASQWIFRNISKIPQNLFCGLVRPRYLNFSAYDRCSSSLMEFLAQCLLLVFCLGFLSPKWLLPTAICKAPVLKIPLPSSVLLAAVLAKLYVNAQLLLLLLHFSGLFSQCELHSSKTVLLKYLEVLSI